MSETVSRRGFLGVLSAVGLAAAGGARAWPRSGEVATSRFQLSTLGCGRATGYAETNKIVTLDGKTHVAWLDSADGAFIARARTLDRAAGRWSPTVTLGEAQDNHGGPALAVDGRGFLHAVWGPHHEPFRYRRSRRPNDVSEWEDEIRFGGHATYPTLLCGADDTLYLTCRESFSDRSKRWVVRLYTKPPGESWRAATTILVSESRGYAHFQEALAWGPGQKRLHMSCRLYDSPGRRGHTVAYLYSDDLGVSWRRADGKPLELPATAASLVPVAQDREGVGTGLRCGTLAVDASSTPFVVYSSYDTLPTRAWLASPEKRGDDGEVLAWRHRPLRDLLPAAYADWGVNLPGGIVETSRGELVVALTMMKPAESTDPGIWGHPSSEPLVLRSRDGGATFAARVLTTPDEARARWLPNLERPTRGAPIVSPSLLYTDGVKGATNDDILANGVHWVDLGEDSDVVR